MYILIIDKKQRVKLGGTDAYWILNIKDRVEKDGHLVDVLYYDDLFIGYNNGQFGIFTLQGDLISFDKYHKIIVRGFKNNFDIKMRRYILKYLKDIGLLPKVFNGKTISELGDYSKIEQYMYFVSKHIPTIPFYWGSEYNSFFSDDELFLKNNLGLNKRVLLEGEYKIKKDIRIEKNKYIKEGNYNKSRYLIQPKLTIDVDYRVYISSTSILGLWSRSKATNSLITVDGKGVYRAINYIPPGVYSFASNIKKLLKPDFVAIDFVELDGQMYLLEVNLNPGMKAYVEKVPEPKDDIVAELVKAILR